MTARLVRKRVARPVAAPSMMATAWHHPANILAGVEWSPAYLAFLTYVFVITTYRLQIGTAAMVVALVLLPLERRPLRFPSLILWSVAFLGWAFVGWGVSPFPTAVWNTVSELSKFCGVMIVGVNVLSSRPRIRLFLLLFLGFFAFYPVRGALFSYFVYGGTLQGRAVWNYVYNNPNDLAALCLLPLALALGMLVTERQRWIRYCAMAGAVVLPLVILLTESRGAFIALTLFGVVILRSQKGRRTAIVLTAAAVAVSIFLLAPESLWKRLGTLTQVTNEQSAAKAADDMSARQRLEIWKVARTIALEHPITGVGLGAYPDVHYEYAQRPIFDNIAFGHRDAHSTYFRLLAESGIVGTVLFAMMVFVTIRHAQQTRRAIGTTRPRESLQLFYMEIGLLGYGVAGIWGSYHLMVLTYLYLAIIFAASSALRQDPQSSRLPSARFRSIPTGASRTRLVPR